MSETIATITVTPVEVLDESSYPLPEAMVIDVPPHGDFLDPEVCVIAEFDAQAIEALVNATGIKEHTLGFDHGAYYITDGRSPYAGALITVVSSEIDGIAGASNLATILRHLNSEQREEVIKFVLKAWD